MDGIDAEQPMFRGEVAHIVAEQRDGPRGESTLTPQQRNHQSNLLLLCFDHHAEIDTRVDDYPVERLHQIKNDHSSWLNERLREEERWTTKLHNFFYLNVPRLQALAAFAGVSIDLSRYGHIVALHELGWDLNRLMLGFKSLLQQADLKAIPLEKALTLGHSSRGALVSFDGPFRTKNIDMPETTEGYRMAVRGDPSTDPQIYKKVGDVRVTLYIDPRWITTTTAFVHFRPPGGRGSFAGLGLLNSFDAKRVNVTPLVLGLPSTPFMDAFFRSD
nr:hypothetical protein [Hydrogenophaga borbori]